MNPMLARIRWRLVGWSVLVIVVVLAIAGTAVYAAAAAGLRDQIDRDLEARANAILSGGLIETDTTGLGPEGYHGATFSLLVGPRGEVLANPQRLDAADIRRLTGGQTGFRDVTLDEEPARVLVRALPVGRASAFLVVGRSIEAERAALARLLVTLVVSGIGALVLALVGASFLAGRALVPIAAAFRHQREFVADASHELRTPLTVMRAAADLLDRHRDEPLSTNLELLADMRHELDRTERLVDDMLTLARSDLGELTLSLGRVDLGALAEALVRRTRPLAASRSVTLEHRHEGAPIVVEGDPDRLEQALLVLVDNALAHAPSGSHVTVTTAGERSEAVIRVRDDGPGIPRDELPHVFDRFYRGDRARTRRSGAGLGLAIARTLVRAHRGELSLESPPGGGTVATMRLPQGAPA